MGHRHVDYGKDSKESDVRAISDIKAYVGHASESWEILLVEAGKVEALGTNEAFNDLQLAMSFMGIGGYPVHAFGRKYCRTAYKAWMAAGNVKIDEDCFPVREKENTRG